MKPIQLYLEDMDDDSAISHACQVVTMLERWGYPVGSLYVAPRSCPVCLGTGWLTATHECPDCK